jgi:uncharacterized membrane protein
VGATLLGAAFVTDIAYWLTLNGQWETSSIWLLTGGLIVAFLAALTLLAEVLLRRVGKISWPRFIAIAVAALLALVNAFVHSRDGYTAVVPTGIALSFITTLIIISIGVRGWDLTSLSGTRP